MATKQTKTSDAATTAAKPGDPVELAKQRDGEIENLCILNSHNKAIPVSAVELVKNGVEIDWVADKPADVQAKIVRPQASGRVNNIVGFAIVQDPASPAKMDRRLLTGRYKSVNSIFDKFDQLDG